MRKLNISVCISEAWRVARDGDMWRRGYAGWALVILAAGMIQGAAVAPPIDPGAVFLVTLPAGIAKLIGAIGIAVNTHRRILLGEPPAAFRLGASERAYFRRIFGIGLRWLPVALLLGLAIGISGFLLKDELIGGTYGLMVLVALPLMAVAWFYLLPFSLGLPAAAAGRAEFTLKAAFALGSGHRWALTLIGLGCEAPVIVVSLVGSAILGQGGAIAGLWSGAMVVVTTILNAAWLSLVFKALADGDPELAREA